MRECLNPYNPELTRRDDKSGKAVYPSEGRDRRLGDNQQEGFPCYRCEACRKNRRWRWVGRCLAEQHTCEDANFITLTYGHDNRYRLSREVHDHPHAFLLVKSDVQNWLKRLRAAGHNFSYAITGERGDLKGRAHWHVAIFWRTDKIPEHTWGRNWNDRFWPHGVVDWKPLNEASVAYICQYILAATDAESAVDLDKRFRMGRTDDEVLSDLRLLDDGALSTRAFLKSTGPPLGSKYFENRAFEHVKAGIAPADGVYSFPGVVIDKGPLKGKPKHFFLSDNARDRFLASFVRQWHEHRAGQEIPHTDYVREHLDRVARPQVERFRGVDPKVMRNVLDTGTYYATRPEAKMTPYKLRMKR